MKSVDFLVRLAEALDYDGVLSLGQDLESIEGWDSLGILSVIELLEEIGAKVNIDVLYQLKTTDDLIAVAGVVAID